MTTNGATHNVTVRWICVLFSASAELLHFEQRTCAAESNETPVFCIFLSIDFFIILFAFSTHYTRTNKWKTDFLGEKKKILVANPSFVPLGGTRIEHGNRPSMSRRPDVLANEQCNGRVRCDRATSDANVMHCVNSMSTAMWSLHPEIRHNLHYD